MAYFRNADELRGLVVQSLSDFRRPDLTEFHRYDEIPSPPEPYIGHPYTLLKTESLVGRRQELRRLADWTGNPGSDVYQARVFTVVAIDGMGRGPA